MGHSIIAIEDSLANIDIVVLDIIDTFVLQRTKRTPSNKEIRLINDIMKDQPNGRSYMATHPITKVDCVNDLICPKRCLSWEKVGRVPSFKEILFKNVIERVIPLKNGKNDLKLKKVRKRS